MRVRGGGRQIILNKYIICVTNNTVRRKTNELENERKCFFDPMVREDLSGEEEIGAETFKHLGQRVF